MGSFFFISCLLWDRHFSAFGHQYGQEVGPWFVLVRQRYWQEAKVWACIKLWAVNSSFNPAIVNSLGNSLILKGNSYYTNDQLRIFRVHNKIFKALQKRDKIKAMEAIETTNNRIVEGVLNESNSKTPNKEEKPDSPIAESGLFKYIFRQALGGGRTICCRTLVNCRALCWIQCSNRRVGEHSRAGYRCPN